MKVLFGVLSLVLTMSSVSFGASFSKFELGLGAGTTHPYASNAFKDQAKSGDAQAYWLGYRLDPNKAIEIGFEGFDFDRFNSKHQAIVASGVYRFSAENFIHPVVKLGLGTVQSTLANDDKTNSFLAKLAGGLEADFRHFSVGALMQFHYIAKAGEADAIKNMQFATPMLYLTIHPSFAQDSKSSSAATAPVTAAEVVPPKDSDKDGIADDDDKCPNTLEGIQVNAFGCSEKEKVSIKLNIEFLEAKATFDPVFNTEIQNLAAFMRKHPNTKVEVAGYTDNQGSPTRNEKLSQKRADSVKTALIKAGVDPDRITAKGYGPSNPVASNKTAEGRKQNRRVMAEISVLSDKKK